MKILHITSTFLPLVGGQEKVVYELAKRQIKLGHEVHVLTTDLMTEEKTKQEEEIEKIKVIRFHNRLYLGGYGYCPKAINWLKKNYSKFDVIHSHGYNRYLSEFAIPVLAGKKRVIFTPHGFIHTKKNMFFKKIHGFTFGRKIQKADICTGLTKLDFEDYQRLGVDKNKIKVIPNGVETKEFDKITNKEVLEFKKKYKLSNKTLLYVGRIHQSKGIGYILKAIKDIDCQFLIVGKDAGHKNQLGKEVKELGIIKKVIFTGMVSDKELAIAYKSADIFVLFSEWEGFGVTLIEAMAAGLPLVTSNRGAIPYVVENEKQGFIVEYKNVNRLAEKLKMLLKDDKLRKDLGKNGKIKAKQYEWEQVTKSYLEIYKDE